MNGRMWENNFAIEILRLDLSFMKKSEVHMQSEVPERASSCIHYLLPALYHCQ